MIDFNVKKQAYEGVVAASLRQRTAQAMLGSVQEKETHHTLVGSKWIMVLICLLLGMSISLQAQNDCDAAFSVPLNQVGPVVFGNGQPLPQADHCTCATADAPACVLVKITSVPENIDEMGCTLVIDPIQADVEGFSYQAMDMSCTMIDNSSGEIRIPISSTTGTFEFFLCKSGSAADGPTGVRVEDVYLESCCQEPEPVIEGDLEVCAGRRVRYEADAITAMTLGITYNWVVSSNGTIVDGGGLNDDFVEVVWASNGTVDLTANNPSFGGCSGSASTANVTVTTLPSVEAGTYVSMFTTGNAITLHGFPSGPGGSWTGSGVTDNGDGTGTFDPATSGEGSILITYTYTTDDGCTGSDDATILVTNLDDIEPTELGCDDTFYDTGGPDRRYTDEPTITIICPDNPGQVVQVDFQSFDVAWDDMLKTFDGNSVNAPIIDPGSGMGQGVDAAPNGGIVTASCDNMSGCLTFVLCVDDAGFGAGWHALIECVDRPDTEFDCSDLEDMYKVADCGEEEVTLYVPIPYHTLCGEIKDVRITASCSDYVQGIPPGGTIAADGNGTIPLTFPLGIHTLTFSSTMLDHDDFRKTIRVRVTASRMRCKDAPVVTTWDQCYVHLEPSEILEGDCLYNNDDTDVEFSYEVEIEGVDIVEYNDDGYPIIDITNVDCGSTYQITVVRSYVLDWNCNGDASDDDPLEDECTTFITIEDYVAPIIENGPAVVEIPCYDDPGEQAIFGIGHGGGQVYGPLTGSVYLIPGIEDIQVIDNCEYEIAIGEWEYEAADCTTEPLDTDAPAFHYYQRKIVVVDQCGNRHSYKQRVAIVQPPIYPPVSVYEADCTTDLEHLALVQAWYDWVADGRPEDDPRAEYAWYVPMFDPTPNVVDGTTDASGDEIPVAPNNGINDFPNCGYNVTYEDAITPAACAGSQEIWRTWSVFNWCKSSGNQSDNYHQLINVGDGYPPQFVDEPVFTFTPYAGDADCKGEITFWHPNVVDACGGNVFATITYNGVEKSFVGGPVSFQNIMAGTTITVTFTATDECDDEAQMDYEVTIEGCCTPVIVCPGIQSVYLNDVCEATLLAYTLAQESSSACGALTYEIALQSDDSDGDGYPEDEDYSDQVIFTDADLLDCQQTGYTVILRFTDQNGQHYYCEVEVWVKMNQDTTISCEDINPYIIYGWDAMADDLYRVSQSSDPVAGFQRLMDSGGLGTSLWENTGCLGNTWIEIIDVDYHEYYAYCLGGRICYTFKIRNECGYTSDICQNCVIIDAGIDWTMNFPPDQMVADGMIPQPATLGDIVSDNSDSWQMEVVVETAYVEDCSRKLIYNYYLKNLCTWDDHDDCAAIVERPDGMTTGVILRYQSNAAGTGNAIDDGNEALDNDGFNVTSRVDDGDFVRLPSSCNPRNTNVYTEISSITGSNVRCVSAQEYGYIHYQQMIVVDSGDESIPIIQVLNLGPFCDTNLSQDENGYCLVPVEISACIEFGCDEGALSDFSVMLKPFGEGEAIVDPYGSLVIIDEKTCAIQGHYPLHPDLAVTSHVLIVTDGNYQFEIPFIVEDCTPAVIALEEIGPFCGGDITNTYGGCSAEVDIRATFDFGCGYSDIRDYEIKLKPFGEGPAITDPYGEVFYIDEHHLSIQGEYPLDPHNHITEHVLVIGSGDNIVELPFMVKDCTPPVIPDCYDFVVEGHREITLRAKDLDNGSYDLCTDYNDLQFYFADPLEYPDVTELRFSCEDGTNGIIPYTIWVVDEWGNAASCSGSVIIQGQCDDDGGGTGAGAAAIAGHISMDSGDMIENVEVNLRGGAEKDMMTGNDGLFVFEELPTDNEYIARPYRNDKAINGVTTYDLVFISRHILGTRLFSSPYEMIAADVNNSGSITTFDLVLLRKLILGEVEDFNNNTSWRFIPKSYEFPDPSNPWVEDFPEEININSLDEDIMDNDFIGIKVGDVNGSATPSNVQGNVAARNTNGQIFFQAEDISMKAGASYAVPFYLEAGTELAAYQFSLAFDTDIVDLSRIEAGTVGLEYFGMKYAKTGVITSSWNSSVGVNLDASRPMFYAVFRSKVNTQLSEVIELNSSRLRAEAYTENDDILDVQLAFNGALNNSLKVYQNIPNPFSNFTKLSFFLPEASEVIVEVLNTSGQLLKTYTYQLIKGKHEVRLDLNGLPEEGLFYYQLRSNKETATGRMVRIQE